VEWVRNRINGTCSLKVISLDNLFYILTLAPGIDIVRCKECKRRMPRVAEIDGMGYCSKLLGWTNDTDFCSWAERNK